MGNFAENLNLGNRFRPPLQKRQAKLISSERVICQLDFHLALKFHTHVVLHVGQ